MKSQLSIVEKRAISSKKLQNRPDLNKKLGSKDLTKWLFSRYKIKNGYFNIVKSAKLYKFLIN